MTRLTILHETRYTYERPVSFGPHRLLVRPRDSHAVRLVEASLALSPGGETRWVYDALGNCVCWFEPRGEARELVITSRLSIERFPAPLSAAFRPDDPKTRSPIVYDLADRVMLEPFITPVTEDEDSILLKWLQSHTPQAGEPALDFLLRLNKTLDAFDYKARSEEGVLSPAETIRGGTGTCRDYAWLMVEAVRRLGYAARFVTGYLHDPAGAKRGAGATHAWCQVFLPCLGWTEFDPTNGLAESPDLIAVAVTRTPKEAAPVSGVVIGDPGRSALQVKVEVTLADPLQAAA